MSTSQLSVTDIIIYPVKSCAGIHPGRASLDRFGLCGDRRWMLVDHQGKAITQREHASLALVQVGWREDGLYLRCGEDDLEVAKPSAQAPRREVTVWADVVRAADAGEEAACWLSDQLGIACRLVHLPDDSVRPVSPLYAKAGQTVSFADAFPLLLVSQASLDDLNARLEKPVPMNRFRPNLVVSGCAPFAEDSWKKIRIAGVVFDVAKPCDRCVIPSIDQHTATRDRAINRVLASYRRRGGKIYFGQNLLYSGSGEICLSAPVEVLE